MDVVTRRRAWPVLLTALVLTVMSGLLLPGPASADEIWGEKTIYTNMVSGGDGTRTPDIIATSANNAVVVWREGLRPGNVDMGYVRYSYTTDGGANWSRPQMLAQETSEWAWHYVVLHKVGSTLYAFLGRTPIRDDEPDGKDEKEGFPTDGINHNGLPINGTFLKRSTDQGHSWQDVPDASFPDMKNLALSGRPAPGLINGEHVMPYWASPRENGVLLSSDMKTWRKGGSVRNGNDPTVLAGENQIAVSQDDPTKLVMVARSKDNAAWSTGTYQSASKTWKWDDFIHDPVLHSDNIARPFFTKDGNGQYLYIYNRGTGFYGDRDILDYKTRRPGAAWSAAKDFANGSDPEDTAGTGKGWDNYPMADEYAPGKFWVVWEFDTTRIKMKRLDISGAP